jgi:hypothetical protein
LVCRLFAIDFKENKKGWLGWWVSKRHISRQSREIRFMVVTLVIASPPQKVQVLSCVGFSRRFCAVGGHVVSAHRQWFLLRGSRAMTDE